LCAYVGVYKASHKSNRLSVPQGYVEMVKGVEGIPWRWILWHTLANRALVYPSQGGKYYTKGLHGSEIVKAVS